ncbi:MAG: histidine phosphatase family protein [Candidatus Kerfeldbacteria bacterium]|nr:histidine phosphatase family protein [Candidatus Kerfeldbacteria bacterium]
MSHLLFVRHGQDEDNANRILNGRRDRPLTTLGQRQAAMTARRLAILRPDVVYVSPLQRARQTAAIISELLGLRQVIELPELIERDFGSLTGIPYDEIADRSSRTMQAHGFTVFLEADGSERHAEVAIRAMRGIAAIHARHPDERVLCVSHGDVFKGLLMGLEHQTLEQAINDRWLENAEIADLGIFNRQTV